MPRQKKIPLIIGDLDLDRIGASENPVQEQESADVVVSDVPFKLDQIEGSEIPVEEQEDADDVISDAAFNEIEKEVTSALNRSSGKTRWGDQAEFKLDNIVRLKVNVIVALYLRAINSSYPDLKNKADKLQ